MKPLVQRLLSSHYSKYSGSRFLIHGSWLLFIVYWLLLLGCQKMEVFLNDDLSLSFMVQNIYTGDDIIRTPGQQLMGMGAELLEAGDDYSIHTGQEGDFEYYAKILDDSTRTVTVILRYLPDRAGAAEGLKQYVHDYQL